MELLVRLVMLCATLGVSGAAMAAWEPERPVEFVVPAGVGGSLDEMARLIQDIIIKHNLMKQDLFVVNMPGGAGGEGLLTLKRGQANSNGFWSADGTLGPHRIMIAGNNLFSIPLATGAPFSWKDVSPVAMLMLEPSVLWTHSQNGYKSALEYISAAKAAGPGKMRMGGIGSKQDDQFVTMSIEKATGVKFTYVPFKGREITALQLVDRKVDSSVSKPAEAETHWRAGALTPHCVFNEVRMPYLRKVTETKAWSDIPTCKEAGIDISYQSLRGIFMQARVTEEQIAYYIALFKKVRETPEWKAYAEKGAYDQTFMTGLEFKSWLARMDESYQQFLTPKCDFVCK